MNQKKIILILGDQLDIDHPGLVNFNHATDQVLMIESPGEAQYVWSHKARIALFLSAMRHFAQSLTEAGYPLRYIKDSPLSLIESLRQELLTNGVQHLVCVMPGEWRLKVAIEELAKVLNVELTMLEDTHFYCSLDEFKAWADSKKELRMEFFYRYMRKKHDILIDENGEPKGGRWNYDDQNRKPYSKQGPGLIPPPLFFEKDKTTLEVINYVETQYANHPGSLDDFAWAVTREDALKALKYFVAHRLSNFGMFQDAMWKQTAFGWHSLLSAALNLKLISPREVVNEVLLAYEKEGLDLATVEGFIRQIIGWREFVRGIYFLDMPDLAQANFYGHTRPLPDWYWTANTKMNCMKDAIGQTMQYGYAHHIQRLMLTGNFALLAELLPSAVSDWYLAVYVDAVEWVEMPNVLGMALFANGGRFTSKPYIASGAYIHRMSNYCDQCCYQPSVKWGDNACPVTTLYWNFLINHQQALDKNPRTRLMTANLKRLDQEEIKAIQLQALKLLQNLNEC